MITPPALVDLDPTLVDQALTEMLQVIAEDDASLDLRRGAFSDLLVYNNALLGARQETELTLYRSSRSLLDISTNPDLADEDLVDAVLSNFRMVRKEGATASGDVAIVVSTNVTATISAGALFTAGGLVFAAPAAITAKAQASQVNSDTDRLFTQTADGNYVFTVPVIAQAEGPASQLLRGTTVVPDSFPPGFVAAYAAADFEGGLSPESTVALIARLDEGLSARTMSNRLTMKALLRNTPPFDRIVRSSIIGFNNPEMTRDRHTIFGVSAGGRIDWYVRTAEQPVASRVVKEAAYTGAGDDGIAIWQISITRDDAPGFYEIRDIRPIGLADALGGLEIVETIRGYDLSGYDPAPDLTTMTEAAATRWQTGVVRFKDPATDLAAVTVGSRAEYELGIVAMPLIQELQDFVSSNDQACLGADCIIKAVVPCFVQINFTIDRSTADDAPDLSAVRVAVAAAVNSVGFTGRLYASDVHAAIRAALGTHPGKVSTLDLYGRILYPDGSEHRIRDSELLEIPDEPENGVSARTVQFIATVDDVAAADAPGLPSGD